jgi:hypothetical protein
MSKQVVFANSGAKFFNTKPILLDAEKPDPNLLTSRLDTESIIDGPKNTEASQVSEKPSSIKPLSH